MNRFFVFIVSKTIQIKYKIIQIKVNTICSIFIYLLYKTLSHNTINTNLLYKTLFSMYVSTSFLADSIESLTETPSKEDPQTDKHKL